MSSAFDDFSFAEPSSVSSRQFLLQSYVQHPSDGANVFYGPGQTTRIEISGMSQNTFPLARTMKLNYYALSRPTVFDTAAPTGTECQQLWGVENLNQADGIPFVGASHLASVQCELPGVSSQMGPLTSDGYSQLLYTTRLLCSGDVASLKVDGDITSIEGEGQVFEAGLQSYVSRAGGIKGASFRKDYGLTGFPVYVERWGGAFKKRSVPASAFFSLADGASSVLPLPYLTSSSSNLITTINWASVKNALASGVRSRGVDALTYVTTGVHLAWSAVSVVDADVLSKIQILFRGGLTLPIGGVTIPVPMTLSHRDYKCAATTLNSATGSVSLRIPAGTAATQSFVVRILPDDGAVSYTTSDSAPYIADSREASYGLAGIKPIITDMQIEIGSARYPARPIGDLYVPAGQVPRGLSDSKWALNVSNTVADARNADVGGATYVPISDAQAADAYRIGRSTMSLFDDDKFQCAPAAPMFSGMASYADATLKASQSSVVVFGQNRTASLGGNNIASKQRDPEETSFQTYSPGLYIFNLQSLLSEESLKARGFSINAVDLRNQSDVTLSFTISGVAPPGVNSVTSTAIDTVADVSVPAVSRWRCTAWNCFTELVTVLPSRVDLHASSSLIPSAAGSVASS